MLVLLSCAKTMSETSKVKVPLTTVPRFQKEASGIALQMSQFSVDELERLLRINARMAVENYKRYQAFHAEDTSELPALLAYTGIVFKRLNAKDFSKEEFEYGTSAVDFFLLWVVEAFRCHSFLPLGRRRSVAGTG